MVSSKMNAKNEARSLALITERGLLDVSILTTIAHTHTHTHPRHPPTDCNAKLASRGTSLSMASTRDVFVSCNFKIYLNTVENS